MIERERADYVCFSGKTKEKRKKFNFFFLFLLLFVMHMIWSLLLRVLVFFFSKMILLQTYICKRDVRSFLLREVSGREVC